MQEYITNNANETAQIAASFAKTLKPGAVVCLYGEMGVGKTVFCGGFCAALGVKDYVTSPTFTIVNEYDGENLRIFHFDMYRIEEEDELLEIGFEEYLNSGGIVLIEWPQNVCGSLPTCRTEVTIDRTFETADSRRITIKEVEVC